MAIFSIQADNSTGKGDGTGWNFTTAGDVCNGYTAQDLSNKVVSAVTAAV